MGSKTFDEILNDFKPYIAAVSATAPLIILISSVFINYNEKIIDKFWLGIIVYNISLIIYFLRDIQKSIEKKLPRDINKIQLVHEFWEAGTNFKSLNVNALNGKRFIEMLTNNCIHVHTLRLIVPSKKAIETYYSEDKIVSNQINAVNIMVDSVHQVIENMEKLKNNGDINNYEIKYLSTFPLDFYALFDNKYCLVGKYLKDPNRSRDIGLKSLAWVEKDIQLVNHYSLHFQELWSVLDADKRG